MKSEKFDPGADGGTRLDYTGKGSPGRKRVLPLVDCKEDPRRDTVAKSSVPAVNPNNLMESRRRFAPRSGRLSDCSSRGGFSLLFPSL